MVGWNSSMQLHEPVTKHIIEDSMLITYLAFQMIWWCTYSSSPYASLQPLANGCLR